jgi:enterochelin esterase family protein
MILAFDGGEYLTALPLPHLLDSLLAAHAVTPLVAVLIDNGSGASRLDDLANRAWFVDFIGNEVVPWIRARWQVSRDPRRSLITGSSAGGLAAVHIALRRPDLFGNALSQSGAFWRGREATNGPPYEWLVAQAARWPRGSVRFWLEVGSTESRGALGGSAPSILSANRAMRDTLRAKGYDVTYVEVPDGVHAPETWAPRLPAGIAALMGQK